ncbi:MAG TPA: VanW family protein [Pseudonocardia sp.]|nr:VanW family protein [Pseudonocardia sp.]
MPDRHNEPDLANQATEIIPAVGRHRASRPNAGQPGPPNAGQPGQPNAGQPGPPNTGQPGPDGAGQQPAPDGPTGQRGLPDLTSRLAAAAKRHWRVPAAVLGALVLAYLVDLAATRGDIPRGVQVSGVALGGLSESAAQQTLIAELTPDLSRNVPIRAGQVGTSLAPSAAGLQVDWGATIDAAARQPLNPFTRLASFFVDRDVDVVTVADDARLGDALDGINTLVRKDPTDGGVRYDGSTPTVVHPSPGLALDLPAAAAEIKRDWTTGQPIDLPVVYVEPAGHVGDAAIHQTIAELAGPAVATPVRVLGNGREATLSPAVIAGALSFTPDGAGGLKPVLDIPKLSDAVRPELVITEQPAKDASVSLTGGTPVVTPSVDGHGIDYPATFAGLVTVLKRPVNREVSAIYAPQPAKLTTEAVNALGIKGSISTFSTGGFAADSGQNIKRAAETINGKILKPGETFSLNDATGPRDAPQGYVPAGIIEDGHPARGIGGGVSQLATTLYNAAYFAGMTDVGHQEHSYYISRYPVAREATVYEGAIDLKFRNDLPTGVLIQTAWTPASLTVTFWGTKRFEVTSATSPRTSPVPPQTLNIPAGQPCTPSAGGEGFTATDTRTLRDLDTGQTKTSTHTVHYKPSPAVVCAPAPEPEAPPN